jgi:hypothetical protein
MNGSLASEWGWERVAYRLSLATHRPAADTLGGPFSFCRLRKQFGRRAIRLLFLPDRATTEKAVAVWGNSDRQCRVRVKPRGAE